MVCIVLTWGRVVYSLSKRSNALRSQSMNFIYRFGSSGKKEKKRKKTYFYKLVATATVNSMAVILLLFIHCLLFLAFRMEILFWVSVWRCSGLCVMCMQFSWYSGL